MLSTLQESSSVTRGVLLFFILATFSFILWQWKSSSKNKLPLPPKPPGVPILGNLPEFIKAAVKGEMHLLLQKWTEEYGEIVRVQLGPITAYYVGSDVAVKEIFERNQAYTAERPRWIVSNEQICNKLNVLLLNGSSPRWKVSISC
jgi:Cytochrome P450